MSKETLLAVGAVGTLGCVGILWALHQKKAVEAELQGMEEGLKVARQEVVDARRDLAMREEELAQLRSKEKALVTARETLEGRVGVLAAEKKKLAAAHNASKAATEAARMQLTSLEATHRQAAAALSRHREGEDIAVQRAEAGQIAAVDALRASVRRAEAALQRVDTYTSKEEVTSVGAAILEEEAEGDVQVVDGALNEYVLSATLTGHDQEVRCVCEGPNDSVITGSRDGTAMLWRSDGASPPHYSCVATFVGHTKGVSAVAVIPADEAFPAGRLVTGSLDNTVRIWDLESGEQKSEFTGHTQQIQTMAVTGDGRVVTGSWDGTARVWSIATGESTVLDAGTGRSVLGVVALSGQDVVTASVDELFFWRDGQLTKRVQHAHNEIIRHADLLPDGRFVTASNDETVKVWDASGNCQAVLSQNGHRSLVFCATSGPGDTVLSTSEDKTVKLWSESSCIQTIPHPVTPWGACSLANGDIATAAQDCKARIFTRVPARVASRANQDAFESEVTVSQRPAGGGAGAGASAGGGGSDLGGLPVVSLEEMMSSDGTAHGQQVLATDGSAVYVYSWNSSTRQWDLLGEVVGTQ